MRKTMFLAFMLTLSGTFAFAQNAKQCPAGKQTCEQYCWDKYPQSAVNRDNCMRFANNSCLGQFGSDGLQHCVGTYKK